MKATPRLSVLVVPFLALALAADPASAQLGGLKKLKDKAKQKVEQKVESTKEGLLEKVECSIDDSACVEQAQAEGKAVEIVDESGKPVEKTSLKPGQGAWSNYDFVPGDRVIFATDFSEDVIGDFPRRLEFQSGALEVVEWQGGRWLRATDDSRFIVPLPEVMPGRFTMEFDFAIPAGEVWIYFGESDHRRIEFGGDGRAAVRNVNANVAAHRRGDGESDRIRHGRVLADGKYIKVYLDDTRVLNVPNADFERTNQIVFWTDANEERPTLFGNFRIAAGGRKLYDALNAEGRVATQGIYFDTGSDRIRPESTPTLKEIGAMLKEHPELKLTIEGHTDNVGNAASNQTLSEKRAAAVRQHLVDVHGVAAERLQARGLGPTKPVAPNETAEGRQQNRRVELVKL